MTKPSQPDIIYAMRQLAAGPAIKGVIRKAGTDDEYGPCLVIETTEAQLKAVPTNLYSRQVRVLVFSGGEWCAMYGSHGQHKSANCSMAPDLEPPDTVAAALRDAADMIERMRDALQQVAVGSPLNGPKNLTLAEIAQEALK